MAVQGELLRGAMRYWTTGVAVCTTVFEDRWHGMTVNSFTSLSLFPPRIAVTMANPARTCQMVVASGVFGITILSQFQKNVADLFAGKLPDKLNRFDDILVIKLETGVPFISGGLVFIDCRVVHQYHMPESTLFIGEVVAVQHANEGKPLVYYNRNYHELIS